MRASLRLVGIGSGLVALALFGCGSDTSGSPNDGGKGGQKGDGEAGHDGGADSKMDAFVLHLDAIAPPATLTATVVDRRETLFELVWTAPSVGGAAATGYQVRYAKVPITATNFDDTTVTTAVPYVGTPKAPGETDGMTVKLYIENGYYFAVEGTGAAGAKGAIDATTAAVAAHFNQTIITSPGTTGEIFGASSDGSGDVNGDQISDIVVGTSNAGRAYLFLGAATFAGGMPSVTFSSATDPLFGTEVAQVGDIDGDGFQDIAVSDATIGTIYIFKGRATWPMALTDLQADYAISSTGGWALANAGASLARLGDFDGDGIDDFAIGGPSYSTRVGRVAVVYGSKTFTSFSLPNALRSFEIGGDPALNRTQFGLRMVGLGHFYTIMKGTTLVVSAPGLGDATSTSDNAGRLYAFHGRAAAAAIDATMADNVVVGPGKGATIGQVVSNLGPSINALPSVGSGNGLDTLSVANATGTGFVFAGSATTGPFASSLVFDQPASLQIGQMIFGGRTSGDDTTHSLIGSAASDVAVVGSNGFVYIIDGDSLSKVTSPATLAQNAVVQVPLPSDWSSTTVNGGGLIPDVNHDGYPDFVLGDTAGTAVGRIVVFW